MLRVRRGSLAVLRACADSPSSLTVYRRVLHEDLSFEDAPRVFDEDTKSLLRGLLQRDPLLRMTDSRMKRNPYFAAIDWDHVLNKRYVAPFIPTLNPDDPSDTSQFDEAFLGMEPEVGEGVDGDGKSERDPPEGEPQEAFDGEGRDVFDGCECEDGCGVCGRRADPRFAFE